MLMVRLGYSRQKDQGEQARLSPMSWWLLEPNHQLNELPGYSSYEFFHFSFIVIFPLIFWFNSKAARTLKLDFQAHMHVHPAGCL